MSKHEMRKLRRRYVREGDLEENLEDLKEGLEEDFEEDLEKQDYCSVYVAT